MTSETDAAQMTRRFLSIWRRSPKRHQQPMLNSLRRAAHGMPMELVSVLADIEYDMADHAAGIRRRPRHLK